MSTNMIGGFRILEEIHGGGQGKIVKAVCETPPFDGIEPGTVVVLKVMPVFHDEGGRRWTRLQERTSALSKLSHPGVVKYYGCFREQGTVNENHVIVQECLEGDTLKQRLDTFPQGLDADEALRITEAAIAGLEYAAWKAVTAMEW